MGLDMYMYKIEKLTEEEAVSLVGLRACDIREPYHCIDKEVFDECSEMYSDLIPFISEVPVIDIAFNHKAFLADHHISEDDEICGSFFGNDRAGWSFESGARVEIDRAEYESYLYEKETLIYVFKSTEVAYWRKHYDLDEFLEAIRVICRTKQMIAEEKRVPTDDEIRLWKTENCGYYMLSADEKQALKVYLAENADADGGHYLSEWSDLLGDKDSVLMYHAWW